MNEQERRRRREERLRNRKPGIGITFSNYAYPQVPADADEWWYPEYYLQYAATLGLERGYGHPEIEALITFNTTYTGHSVVSYLVKTIKDGARYASGDRVDIPGFYSWQVLGTVEFRESRNSYGPCLRAVVVGVEEAFQSLPYDEIDPYLMANGPTYDPCENL
ncbi:MAG: hypothetical protein IJ518_07880 [Clostridia bacterium]|nr:hypothetical protein [Clostridia bacterium]